MVFYLSLFFVHKNRVYRLSVRQLVYVVQSRLRTEINNCSNPCLAGSCLTNEKNVMEIREFKL
jgi:hypothetical protein